MPAIPILAALLGFVLNAAAAGDIAISWQNNMLRLSKPGLPGEYLDTWYLEAFCRSGSTHRDWNKTTIPHKTELISQSEGKIELRTLVEPGVEVKHEIRTGSDFVEFNLTAENLRTEFVDVQWFQPCIRVDRFTGLKQDDYIQKSFIVTENGVQFLDKLPREVEAIYKGGQVYVPKDISLEDVNPRPISKVRPVNGLIGCVSGDGKWVMGTAWDATQELFQGVIVCLHNDPRIGGLKPGQKKALRGMIYLMRDATPGQLLERYKKDFPAKQ